MNTYSHLLVRIGFFNREWTQIDADSDLEHGGRREHRVETVLIGCGKQLLAVVASRKRCGSASVRNPTANTACGRVLRTQHSFQQPLSLRALRVQNKISG
jgi:hypothetical protein